MRITVESMKVASFEVSIVLQYEGYTGNVESPGNPVTDRLCQWLRFANAANLIG